MTPDVASTAAERAQQAWHALEKRCLVRTRAGRVLAKDGPRRDVSASWPFSQVMAAAAAMLGLGAIHTDVVDGMVLGLERYRRGDGYVALPHDRTRYYDDNAWIALDLLQLATLTGDARYTAAATDLFEFLRRGAAPGGGVYWVEGNQSRNTCSTGPTAQVALGLHGRTGETAYLDFATEQLRWLDAILRDDNDLYRDNLDARGVVEPTIWSYNQGTPIGALVLMARATGEDAWQQRAVATAHAASAFFAADDRLWRSPPVFNAIFFRNVLALLTAVPDAGLLGQLDDYLERAWATARHRRTGLFVDGGIGSYDGNPTIDHAGLTQLFAFRAWSPERWSDIC